MNWGWQGHVDHLRVSIPLCDEQMEGEDEMRLEEWKLECEAESQAMGRMKRITAITARIDMQVCTRLN